MGGKKEEGRENIFLLVRNKLGPDHELFVVRMGESVGRCEVFSAVPHRIQLMGVLKGAAHLCRHRSLVELGILNRLGHTVRLEVCRSKGRDG